MPNPTISNILCGLLCGTRTALCLKKQKELSALSVAKIKENGRHAVGGVDGLHLRIVNDSRSWILRVVVGQRFDEDGKQRVHRRDIGLGSYPEVSLAEARTKAQEMKAQIRNGIDPIQQKRISYRLYVFKSSVIVLSVNVLRL